jgi:osmoprotectant transport system permease protein
MPVQEPLVRWDWVLRHAGDIADRLVEHVALALLAVSIGLLAAFGLALLVRRHPRLRDPILWAAGVVYTVPSLALFALLVPVTGLSRVTAEIGLVGYTLLVLLRGILNGLDSVPAEVRETAAGMGYRRQQVLWQVELPLAMPVIVGAIRVATVMTIGLVTVTALIGQGGLGYFILEGLQRFFSTPLIVGAVLSVLLAVVADVTLVAAQRWLTPWATRRGAGPWRL